ncbi:hypothetical protein AB0D14_18495 [Streptomyces sp. NPDC048484]|uniref:hypothetical protein n=1 Tax=Streptomyces sp. NPDC048484 TaxID=3155146 RepID=UPI003443459B
MLPRPLPLVLPLVLMLVGRLLEWLLPGGGRHRAESIGAGVPASRWTRVGPRVEPPPRPRSPYAREAATDHRVDVTDVPLTRPYYRAAEKRRLQSERRLALALALDGVDYGPLWSAFTACR